MPNIKSTINFYNKTIIRTATETPTSKKRGSVGHKYLAYNIIYKDTNLWDLRDYKKHDYFESTETTFKKIYKKHKKSFNLDRCKTDIKLSNYIEESSHV